MKKNSQRIEFVNSILCAESCENSKTFKSWMFISLLDGSSNYLFVSEKCPLLAARNVLRLALDIIAIDDAISLKAV